jgi:polyhydroxybutyrate depolymerase
MVLHGKGGSADQIAGIGGVASPLKIWRDIGERENLFVIVPEGLAGNDGQLGWNDCRADSDGNPASDDVAFLSLLAQSLSGRYQVSKHFVTGMSNGGHMSVRLAAETPDIFSAAAAVSAAIAAESKCVPKMLPVSVLFMNGTADPILPHAGGKMAGNRGQVLSLIDSLKTVAEWNKIVGTESYSLLPDISAVDQSQVTKVAFPRGPSGSKVEGYRVTGGGHNEPSTSQFYSPLLKAITGQQNRDIECAEIVWDFFADL